MERIADSNRSRFMQGDICDAAAVHEFKSDVPTYLAAESYVDRLIDRPSAFVQTNVISTYTMLVEARSYWLWLDEDEKATGRFYHILTYEVNSTLSDTGLFTKDNSYNPRASYSASKDGLDLVSV